MIYERLLTQIDQGREGKNQGLTTGLDKLDYYTGGNIKSNITVIFSNSGSGKSSLALFSFVYKPIMASLDNDNFKAYYFSLEMSAEKLLCKLLSIYIYETFGRYLTITQILSIQKNYTLQDEDYNLVQQSIPWLKKVESKLIIYDSSLNASKLYSILMEEIKKLGSINKNGNRTIYTPNNPDLIFNVVIDHISLLRPEQDKSLKQEIDLTTAYLITLRNMCNISPIIVQQANREQGNIERRKQGLINMTINDTRDSGDPVQAAETVISILNPHRERLKSYRGYDITKLEDKFRSLTILKSRYGTADVEIGINFFGGINYFKELPKPEEIYDYSNYLHLTETTDKHLDKDFTNKTDNKTNKNFNFNL